MESPKSSLHPLEQFHFCPKCGSSKFEIRNAKAKTCPDCGFVYYFNPCSATVAIIINAANELLVTRRAKAPAQGTLDLPGGFVDPYESAEMAVSREVQEETGLEVLETEFLFSIPNIYPYCGFDVHTTDLFMRCHLKQYEHFYAADDVAESFFMPFDQLRVEDFGLTSIKQGISKLKEMFG